MSYNTKNYTQQGGDTTHFGGKVVFEDGCTIEGLPKASSSALGCVKAGNGLSASSDGTLSVSAATKTVAGGILAVDNLENCAATDVAGVNSFINTYLLARLRSAGILKD